VIQLTGSAVCTVLQQGVQVQLSANTKPSSFTFVSVAIAVVYCTPLRGFDSLHRSAVVICTNIGDDQMKEE
jgi:hypothetical protein